MKETLTDPQKQRLKDGGREAVLNKQKLWGGRFTGTVDPVMQAFNASIGFDRRLYLADIRGSQAYAKGLYQVGVITSKEEDQIFQGLEIVLQEWEKGQFVVVPSDEDVHSANERRLMELVGPVAGKLHTGRSRNDQVSTDMRYWLRDEAGNILNLLKGLLQVCARRATEEIDVLMPGYTHLQRAQPIRWSHLLLSYAASWQADAERLAQLVDRFNVLPLGSGALAGNPFEIDRDTLSQSLKFNRPMLNSLHAVSDRDFVVEFLFWSSLTMVHLSRFSEDLIVYSTAEFGFLGLTDAYSTGSSLMPQKKNSDSLELLRGKTGRVFGHMSGFMMSLKGLPSTYNKDMQEDKEPLFDTVETLVGCLQIATGVLSTLIIYPQKMKAALSSDMLATDLADYLVRKGIPFRESHHISGAAVRLAESRSCALSSLTPADFKQLHTAFGDDVVDVWSFEQSVENRCSVGGTSRKTVLAQIEELDKWLTPATPSQLR